MTHGEYCSCSKCMIIAQTDKAEQNSAAMPGYVRMPTKLTAENGAKAAMMGEFSVNLPLYCPDCNGEGCGLCKDGTVIRKVNIPWTVIKDIYAKAVRLLGT